MREWFLLGLLGHCFQLVDQNISVESAGDSLPESVDRFRDLFVFWVLEQLSQSPGPVEPFRVDLQFLAVVGRDDVIHGPDVAGGVDSDCLA